MGKVTFIVDTDTYSGNFERELCAYMTGHLGETGVGFEQAEEYKQHFKPMKKLLQTKSHSSLKSSVRLEVTPGYWNNGLGFNFKDGDEDLALEKYKEFLKKENLEYIEKLKSMYGKNVGSWTDELLDQRIAEELIEVEEIEKIDKIKKVPAFQSIAITFRSLSSDEIEFLKVRANEFSEISKEKFDIIGFRLKLPYVEAYNI